MSIGLAHLNCRELVELVTAYLEGDLSSGERKRFDAHLSACDGCTMYVEQMRRTIELTGTLSVDDVSRIVQNAIDRANLTRAAIRLPLGSRTRMVISVADLDGNNDDRR